MFIENNSEYKMEIGTKLQEFKVRVFKRWSYITVLEIEKVGHNNNNNSRKGVVFLT